MYICPIYVYVSSTNWGTVFPEPLSEVQMFQFLFYQRRNLQDMKEHIIRIE